MTRLILFIFRHILEILTELFWTVQYMYKEQIDVKSRLTSSFPKPETAVDAQILFLNFQATSHVPCHDVSFLKQIHKFSSQISPLSLVQIVRHISINAPVAQLIRRLDNTCDYRGSCPDSWTYKTSLSYFPRNSREHYCHKLNTNMNSISLHSNVPHYPLFHGVFKWGIIKDGHTLRHISIDRIQIIAMNADFNIFQRSMLQRLVSEY